MESIERLKSREHIAHMERIEGIIHMERMESTKFIERMERIARTEGRTKRTESGCLTQKKAFSQ